MGKVYDELQIQIKKGEFKKEGEDCLIMYNKLIEIGSASGSIWGILTDVNFIGNYPNCERTYKPSVIGRIFLKGIEQNDKILIF